MKEWPTECPCGFHGKLLGWNTSFPLACPDCGGPTTLIDDRPDRATGIITDDYPGGLMVPHGVCHPDGTPRRFDSKTDLKRALNKAGLTMVGDTPKPYRV